MTNNNGLGNLDNLFQSAQEDGLTADTLNLVVSNLNGPTMAGPIGVPLDQLATNEVTLAMNILDMSGSMSPHAADLIRAYNEDYLAAMEGSPAAEDILVSTILFEDKVKLLHGYVNLKDAPRLTPTSYAPYGSTALYDAVAAGLTNMVLYAQQLRQSGVMVRGFAMVYSDGGDNASKQSARDVRRAALELLKQEMYTLAYVGFGMNKPIGFKANGRSPAHPLAAEIGFPHALTAGLNHIELRRIFHLASMSAVQVSQGTAVPTPLFP
jgi:hypothetical protein